MPFRVPRGDVLPYWVSQLIGGLVVFLVMALVFGNDVTDALATAPAPGLADEVRRFLPDALYVRAVFERDENEVVDRKGVGLADLYREYSVARHGEPPSDELTAAFRELCDEVAIDL